MAKPLNVAIVNVSSWGGVGWGGGVGQSAQLCTLKATHLK